MKQWILIMLNLRPYREEKRSNGVIYNYYRNGKVKLSVCKPPKCSYCNCKS